MAAISRRIVLASCAALTVHAGRSDNAYRFATAECDIEMSIEFHDRYSSPGLRFNDSSSDRHFCVSKQGEEERNCPANFFGSLAIVRYRVQPHARSHRVATLRELVRTIDQDLRLSHRPPFERTIELRQGLASDIQAFGYET